MIDTSKYLNKINGTNNKPKKFNYKKHLNRILFLIVLFLINLIVMKKSTTYRDFIYNKVYNNNFSFAKVKEFYNKYLGGVDSLNKVVKNTTPVFNETLTYKSKSKYLDGVKLEVSTNYLVPIIKEGLVVFSGEKEGYGNVIIIQGVDDINIWYGNMSNTSVKLYDYVEKGSLLGEVSNNTLYLVYEKDGKFLDIEEY